MDRHDGRRRERSVRDVREFPCPDSDGEWPCIACGETFAVSESWQIRFEDSGAVVACGRCADHARRNGRIVIPTDMIIRLDQRRDPLRPRGVRSRGGLGAVS